MMYARHSRSLSLPGMAAAIAVATLSSCGGSANVCAPAGTYVPTLTRSADPGSCPANVDVLEAKTVELSANQLCSPDHEDFNGSQISNGTLVCSYQGSGTITPSATGISGKATITTTCWGDGTKNCTANFDISFGPSSGLPPPSDGGRDSSFPSDGPAGDSSSSASLLGGSCAPVCALSACAEKFLPIGSDTVKLTSPADGCGSWCVSSAAHAAYCSGACATDADCATPNLKMKCVSACPGDPQSAVVGLCWSEADYAEIVSSVCHTTGDAGAGGGDGPRACVTATHAKITDFSDWDPAAQQWGAPSGVGGFVAGFAFPGSTATAAVDTAAQNLHLVGTFGPSAGGIGVVFPLNSCIDASSYSGFQFNVSGSAAGAQASLQLGTVSDDCGSGCATPTAAIPATGTISVRWSDLLNGAPKAFDPHEISSIMLLWTSSADGPVDLRIDDIAFVP